MLFIGEAPNWSCAPSPSMCFRAFVVVVDSARVYEGGRRSRTHAADRQPSGQAAGGIDRGAPVREGSRLVLTPSGEICLIMAVRYSPSMTKCSNSSDANAPAAIRSVWGMPSEFAAVPGAESRHLVASRRGAFEFRLQAIRNFYCCTHSSYCCTFCRDTTVTGDSVAINFIPLTVAVKDCHGNTSVSVECIF